MNRLLFLFRCLHCPGKSKRKKACSTVNKIHCCVAGLRIQGEKGNDTTANDGCHESPRKGNGGKPAKLFPAFFLQQAWDHGHGVRDKNCHGTPMIKAHCSQLPGIAYQQITKWCCSEDYCSNNDKLFFFRIGLPVYLPNRCRQCRQKLNQQQ